MTLSHYNMLFKFAPEWAEWYAMDEAGGLFFFEEVPSCYEGGWDSGVSSKLCFYANIKKDDLHSVSETPHWTASIRHIPTLRAVLLG